MFNVASCKSWSFYELVNVFMCSFFFFFAQSPHWVTESFLGKLLGRQAKKKNADLLGIKCWKLIKTCWMETTGGSLLKNTYCTFELPYGTHGFTALNLKSVFQNKRAKVSAPMSCNLIFQLSLGGMLSFWLSLCDAQWQQVWVGVTALSLGHRRPLDTGCRPEHSGGLSQVWLSAPGHESESERRWWSLTGWTLNHQ